jgi:integrase
MPFDRVPAMIVTLRGRESMAALALEFLVLTAGRTGEVLGATWAEFDLQAKVWAIPAVRMKAGREHRVPLSCRAIEILSLVQPLATEAGDLVFPGREKGKPLSNMAMTQLMRRCGYGAATVHGMRSSFRDWTAELTDTPREIAEAALAHSVGDAAERAYRRGDALGKRRILMEAWASYCGGASNVVPFSPAVAVQQSC